METVNIFKAKTDLSKLIRKIEQKDEDKVILARNGKPVAMLVPYVPEEKKSRIGTARGRFSVPEDIDSYDDEILALFGLGGV
ncbi:MAG: type II toxin-antitoxin system Phd/YefM family antitoxin [Firmicutes bacterium]|nr:type II toxin-antitoxin system Phd/YefM family antitoxin [Bacillota bacterium]